YQCVTPWSESELAGSEVVLVGALPGGQAVRQRTLDPRPKVRILPREPALNSLGSHGVARPLASGQCFSPFDSSPAESASSCWPRRSQSVALPWPALTPTGRPRPPPPSLRLLPTPRCPCPLSPVSSSMSRAQSRIPAFTGCRGAT